MPLQESSSQTLHEASPNGTARIAAPALAESWGAEELAATLDSVATGIWAVDLEGRCVFVNQAACRIFGYSREECLGQRLQCILHRNNPEGWNCPKEQCRIQQALENWSAIELDRDVFLHRDGTPLQLQGSIQPVVMQGRMRGAVISVADIAPRMRAEELLRKSDEWLGFAQQVTGVGIFDADLRTGETRVSEGQFLIYGLDPAGKWPAHAEWRKLIHPEDRERMDRELELAQSGGQFPGTQFRIVWPDGSIHWLLSQMKLFFDEAGTAARQVGVNVDVTGRVHAETALNQFFSASPTPMAIWGFDGRIRQANPAWEPILGYTVAELEGLSVIDMVHPEDRASATATLEKVTSSGKLTGFECRVGCKDGSYCWLLLNAGVLKDAQVILATAQDTTKRKAAEEALRESKEEFRELFDDAPVAYHELDMEGAVRRVNRAECALLGYEASEMLGRPIWDFIAGAEVEASRELFRRKLSAGQKLEPHSRRYVRRDGAERWIEIHDTLVRDATGKTSGMRTILLDITGRKQAEERIAQVLQRQRGVGQLRQSLLGPAPLEAKLRKVTDAIVHLFDADFCRIWLTRPGDLCERDCPHSEVHEGPPVCQHRERCLYLMTSSGRYTHIDGPGHRRVPFGCIGRIASGEDSKFLTNDVQNDPNVPNHAWARELGLVSFAGYQLRTPGEESAGVLALFAKHPILPDEDAMLEGLGSTVALVVKQAAGEEALRAEEQTLSESQRIAHVGSWKWELPLETAVCAWTPESYRIFGVSQDTFVPSAEAFLSLIHADDRAAMQAWIGACLSGEEPPDLEFRVCLRDGGVRYILGRGHLERDAENKPIRMTGIAQDITERRRMMEALKLHAEKLARSNEELERFAYVASHDLQEPLRMVASFTQLLAKRYSGQLDETADRYINYAVDGAKRMQQLIADLLAYSRVNNKEIDLRQTDCATVVLGAMRNLEVAIKESDAAIDWDPLPTLWVDQGQLTQLFQNLLANAIKFKRKDECPRIHVSSEDSGEEWTISVQDNGIGIDARHAERVFQIFQRLHTRQEYPGTGIGLAVCKKVVERHGGKLWVESEPGAGSTFRFTIPKPAIPKPKINEIGDQNANQTGRDSVD